MRLSPLKPQGQRPGSLKENPVKRPYQEKEKAIARRQSWHPESSEKERSWSSWGAPEITFSSTGRGKRPSRAFPENPEIAFSSTGRGKRQSRGTQMVSQIARTGPFLETQGVQNSSFELEGALFTLLVEEKAIRLKIVVFRPSSLFPLPVKEKACETSRTRVLSHLIAFSLCLSRNWTRIKRGR